MPRADTFRAGIHPAGFYPFTISRGVPMPLESTPPVPVLVGEPTKLDVFTEHDNFTYADVARLKLVSKQTVYEWVKRGMIPSPIYTGHTARFTRAQVETILTERAEPGTYTPAPSPRADVGKLGGPKSKKKHRNKTPIKHGTKPGKMPKATPARKRSPKSKGKK
jgi:excisionase family DNA binding protein